MQKNTLIHNIEQNDMIEGSAAVMGKRTLEEISSHGEDETMGEDDDRNKEAVDGDDPMVRLCLHNK